MSQDRKTNSKGKQVAVVVGATSKWQSNGRNTLLAHGQTVDDSGLPVGVRWGIGGAIAQKFAQEPERLASGSWATQRNRDDRKNEEILAVDGIAEGKAIRP